MAAEARLPLRNLVQDCRASLRGRLGRAVLTGMGTVLGVGALVAVLGLADTVRVQVSDRFDALRATEVTVTDGRPHLDDPPFPADLTGPLSQLVGVRSGGLLWDVDRTARVYPATPAGRQATLPLMAADPGALEVLRPRMASGRLFDHGANLRGDRVAVLGASAASRLSFGTADGRAAVRIGGVYFTVVGTLADVERRPQALGAVIVPAGTAQALWGPPHGSEAEPSILLETAPGAAHVVGSQVALALRPDAPDRLVVQVPPEPSTVRRQVDEDLQTLLVLLAGVCLAVGGVGIGNATLVSVVERTSELGLRRALGARPRHLAGLIAVEAGLIGMVGGLLGAWAGLLTVLGVSATQGWRPIVAPFVVLAAPLVGGITGVLAGVYPALRAARVEPVQALRT